MNIIEKLGEQFDIYQFKYFGISDWSTNYDIKALLDNADLIKNYFNTNITSINTIDEFIDCLFLEKYVKFNEVANFVNEKYKEQFSNIINFIIEKQSIIRPKFYIDFLKENCERVLQLDNYSIIEVTFDMTFKYYSGLSSVIEVFIEKYFYMILDNFDTIQKIILSQKNYVDLILNERHFEEIKNYRLNEYLDLIKLLKSKHYKVENIVNLIINYGERVYDLINEDNAIYYSTILQDITKFLNDIKHKSANYFLTMNENVDLIMQKYLEKHGHTLSFEISSEKILEPFKNPKISWQAKLLMLTHMQNKNKKFVSYYEEIMQNENRSIVDQACSSTNPTDSYFTITKQQQLNICDQILLSTLQYFLNEKRVQKFFSMVGSLLSYICDEYKIDMNTNYLSDDLNILLNEFLLIFKIAKENNNFALTGLYYGLTMFIFGIIEKLLRLIYKNQNKENYVDIDPSLGDLLGANNETIVKLLGIDNVKIIAYYLIKGNRFETGFNYRNNYAHYKNLRPQDIHYGVVLKGLQIFLIILNTLMLKTIQKEKNND